MSNLKLTLIQGNVLDALKSLPNECVDCIVTSPPYWGLRDYGEETNTIWGGDKDCEHEWKIEFRKNPLDRGGKGQFDEYRHFWALMGVERTTAHVKNGFCKKCNAWYGQLGLEPELELYLKHLLQVTAELRRVLKKTGVMFWNHGDSYGGSLQGYGASRPSKTGFQKSAGIDPRYSKEKTPLAKAKPKCMVMQNYRLILCMIDEQGWILRNTIIWHKPNGMPSSVKDRFSNVYEPVFMLVKNKKYWFDLVVKNKKYWFDLDAVRVQHKTDFDKLIASGGASDKYSGSDKRLVVRERVRPNPTGKNPGDVWKVSLSPKYLSGSGHSNRQGLNRPLDLVTIKAYKEYQQPIAKFLKENIKNECKPILDETFGKHKWRHWIRTDYSGAALPGVEDWQELKEILGLKETPFDDKICEVQKLNIPVFQSGRNPGDLWTIPTQPFPESHFACVDTDTECLTLSGWKRWNELKIGELIAVLDMEKEKIRYEPIEDMVSYHYKGKMVEIKTLSSDMLLTPNHRVVTKRYNRRKKKLGKYRIVLAENLTDREHIPVFEEWEKGSYGLLPSPSKEFAELLGWIIAEGCLSKKQRSIHIYQSLSKNPKKCQRIEYLLNKLEIKYHKRIQKKKYFRVKNGQKTNESYEYEMVVYSINWLDTRKFLGIIPEKRFTPTMLLWSKEALEGLFDGFVGGDGCIRSDKRISITQKDKVNADLFQAICIKVGKRCIVSKRKDGKYALYIISKKYITTRTTNGESSINRRFYDGIVWSPSIRSTTWIARRNGKVFITGNTFPEKLIEPMIKAGCPKWVCKRCGMARVRMVKEKREKPYYANEQSRKIECKDNPRIRKLSGNTYNYPERQTIGWTDCSCPDDNKWKNGVVLDPFLGSGTTMWVARNLGRDCIGIELNPEYIEMAKKRVRWNEGLAVEFEFVNLL